MKAFIYAGGAVFTDRIDTAPAPADLTIAADAGWKTAQKLGVTPRLLVGDFDSLGTPPVSAGVEVVRVPAEKDDTDTQLAVRLALERGIRGGDPATNDVATDLLLFSPHPRG